MKTSSIIRTSVAVLLAAATTSFGQTLIDFNSPTYSIPTDFNSASSSGAGTLSHVTSGGVADTGALQLTDGTLTTGGGYTLTSKTSSTLLNTAGNTNTISTYFKVSDIPAAVTTGSGSFHLGLTSTASGLEMSTTTSGNFISVRLQGVAGAGNNWQFATRYGSTTTAATASAGATQSALTNLDWYKLTTTITKSATANTYVIGGTLQGFGSDGTTAGSTLTYADVTITNANLANLWGASTVYGFFSLRNGSASSTLPFDVGNVDNFSAIPEPATWALLAGSLTAMVVFRRRRSC